MAKQMDKQNSISNEETRDGVNEPQIFHTVIALSSDGTMDLIQCSVLFYYSGKTILHNNLVTCLKVK